MNSIKKIDPNSSEQNIFSQLNKNVIVSITDRLGRLVYANENYCRIVGFNAHEIIGETHKILESPRHKDKRYKDLWKTIKKGNVWNGVLKTSSYQGRTTWLETTIIPIKNKCGNIAKYISIYHEISNNKNSRLEQIESELKYHTLFKLINVSSMIVVDIRGFITEWNKGAASTFGYTKEEILGEHIASLITSKSREEKVNELRKVVHNLEAFCLNETIEMFGVKKNGEEFPLEFTLNKLEIGDRIYYSAIMMDISKRKQLEKKLKAKSRDTEAFLYRSAYELMSPISTTGRVVDLMRQEKVNNNIIEITSILDTTLEKGKLTIHELANSSIIRESNKGTEIINFSRLIENVIQNISETHNLLGIKFKVKILVQSQFHSYANLLKLIFKCLIENAVKYSKPIVSGFEPKITIEIASQGKDIRIKIEDNGKGILRENVHKIFGLFYSQDVNQSTSNGLGLYIVNNIIDELGGEIQVDSEINIGTCFTICIPDSRI